MEWKSIPGYDNKYEVSDSGKIRNILTGKFLCVDESIGYCRVSLYSDGKAYKRMVHQLVLLAFVGPLPVGYEVNHEDGNIKHNDLRNLSYVTKAQNVQHSYDVLRRKKTKGEQIGTSVLCAEDVRAIRALEDSMPHHAIAAVYGISRATVQNILYQRTWRHV